MASYLKFALEDGTVIYVETIETPKTSGGLLPSAKTEVAAEQSPVSFEKSFDAISKMAAIMLKGLREGLNSQPEEVNIAFGLKASSDLSSLIVSRGGPDINYSVSLRWRNEKKAEE